MSNVTVMLFAISCKERLHFPHQFSVVDVERDPVLTNVSVDLCTFPLLSTLICPIRSNKLKLRPFVFWNFQS